MAMYALLEINGDHINDCDPEALGYYIKAVVSNPYCEPRGDSADRFCPNESRVVRVIGARGARVTEDDFTSPYWLYRGRTF